MPIERLPRQGLSKHQENRIEKRERLMRSGFEVFTETGYDDTTVSDIVRRAGMTPSTFYNYFRDKDALLSNIVEDIVGLVMEALSASRANPVRFDDFISGIAGALYKVLADDRDVGNFFRRNLPLVRSLIDHPAVIKLNSEIRSDLQVFVNREEIESVDLDYAVAVLRASLLEVALVMLLRTPPDREGAVEFTVRIVTGALSPKGRARA